MPGFRSVEDLIDLSDFEAYFQEELPRVIQSDNENQICRDQTYFDDTLNTVQYFHGLIISNYRSQLARETSIIESTNNPPSTHDSTALTDSIDTTSTPTVSSRMSYINSQADFESTNYAFASATTAPPELSYTFPQADIGSINYAFDWGHPPPLPSDIPTFDFDFALSGISRENEEENTRQDFWG
jgi:3-dehydroquinate dehydratase